MRSVRLSAKHARILVAYLRGVRFEFRDVDAFNALQRAVEVKPAIRKRRKEKEAKRELKREKFSRLRKQVEARAAGFCECGCGASFWDGDPGEADHFFGKARAESLDTVWLLSRACHRAKTDNNPSAESWLVTFIRHCDRHGYSTAAWHAKARLDAIALLAERAEREVRRG